MHLRKNTLHITKIFDRAISMKPGGVPLWNYWSVPKARARQDDVLFNPAHLLLANCTALGTAEQGKEVHDAAVQEITRCAPKTAEEQRSSKVS